MKSAPRIAVIGAGGHAKVVISTCRAAGYNVVAVYDDREDLWAATVLGVPVLGPVSRVAELTEMQLVIGIGSNHDRQRIARQLPDMMWTSIIHPAAFVDDNATIGAGSVVFAGAVVQTDARIGEHVIINTAATVDHDCVIDDFSHIAPGANVGGSVVIGAGVLVGIGARIIPGVRLGDYAIVGAGAVLINDLQAGSTAVGVPARTLVVTHEPA
jgi:sugar O-acyltransferase (sialic acid O-acetyltransferase NeuD family)